MNQREKTNLSLTMLSMLVFVGNGHASELAEITINTMADAEVRCDDGTTWLVKAGERAILQKLTKPPMVVCEVQVDTSNMAYLAAVHQSSIWWCGYAPTAFECFETDIIPLTLRKTPDPATPPQGAATDPPKSSSDQLYEILYDKPREAGASPRPSAVPTACCMHCGKGKPCGNSCISASSTCTKSGGCACY